MSLAIDKSEFSSVFCLNPKNNYYFSHGLFCIDERVVERIRMHIQERLSVWNTKSCIRISEIWARLCPKKPLQPHARTFNVLLSNLSSIVVRGVMFKTNGDWILLFPSSINSKFISFSLCANGDGDRSTTPFPTTNLKFEWLFVVTQTATWSQLKFPH